MQKQIQHIARDAKLDSIGIPINPNRHAKKTLWQEFWTDFIGIFTAVDDPVGAVLTVFCAIALIIKWSFYCIGTFIFRKNLKKPRIGKAH